MKPIIISEDEDILVLNKPAGITVNNSETTVGEKTVQDWVEEKLKIKDSGADPNSDFFKRSGIVHRLDKETSGILLVAKNQESFLDLQSQFKMREVKKTYIALVHGNITVEEGDISVPVGRLPWNRKRFGVIAGGREAQTHYKVIGKKEIIIDKKKEIITLLELYPKTGRTHQIRVHLKYFNHPIFSDPLYDGRKQSRTDRKYLGRIFLHAAKISFIHPKTKNVVNFEASLPEELQSFYNLL